MILSLSYFYSIELKSICVMMYYLEVSYSLVWFEIELETLILCLTGFIDLLIARD